MIAYVIVCAIVYAIILQTQGHISFGLRDAQPRLTVTCPLAAYSLSVWSRTSLVGPLVMTDLMPLLRPLRVLYIWLLPMT